MRLRWKSVCISEKNSESGYIQSQCRIRAIQKERLGAFVTKFRAFFRMLKSKPLPARHTRPTTLINYVMKLETRLEGAWCDIDFDFSDAAPSTEQLQEYPVLGMWLLKLNSRREIAGASHLSGARKDTVGSLYFVNTWSTNRSHMRFHLSRAKTSWRV